MINHFVYSLGPTSCIYQDYARPLSVIDSQRIYFLRGHAQNNSEIKLSLVDVFKIPFFRGVVHFHSVHFFFIIIICRLFRARSVFTVHTSWTNYSFFHKCLAVICIVFSRATVFVSNASEYSFPWCLRRLNRNKYEVINNSFDVGLLTPSPRKEHWVFCGRLVSVKNVDGAIQIFESLSQEHEKLFIIGDGPLRHCLENKYSALLDRGRLVFTGPVPRVEVYRALEKAKYFVSMSRIEGFPVSVLEAISAGCYTILSDIPAHQPFFACPTVTRVSNSGSNSPELASRFCESQKRDPVKDGRSFIQSNYGYKSFVRAYEVLYEGV